MAIIFPAQPGKPVLEPIRQDLYDTRELTRGLTYLRFFRNPNMHGEFYSNMMDSGQLPHPQQFHVFGIAVEAFPNPTQETGIENWNELKKRLMDAGVLEFTIGAKKYLTMPLGRIINASFPEEASAPVDISASYVKFEDPEEIEPLPEVDEEEIPGKPKFDILHPVYEPRVKIKTAKDMIPDDKKGLCIIMTNPEEKNFYHETFVQREKYENIRVIVTDTVQNVGHYSLTTRQNGKIKPIQIPSQQSFFVTIRWPYQFEEGELANGTVYIRVYLTGVLWREVM